MDMLLLVTDMATHGIFADVCRFVYDPLTKRGKERALHSV